MQLKKTPFGQLPDGRTVDLYTLQNTSGMRVCVITYGGIVTELHAPDRDGQLADVVLGMNSLEAYLAGHPHFGAITGRVGNRIGGAAFTLDNKRYQVTCNDDKHGWCLHGGRQALDKQLWKATPLNDGSGVSLNYLSPDLEEGFPGNLDVTVTYRLTDANELWIDYRATTDKATPVNLTNHSYFNLKGEGRGDVLEHLCQIHADTFTEIAPSQLPTGKFLPVKGTPLDFTQPKPLGQDLHADYPALNYCGGYDQCFAKRPGTGMGTFCQVTEPSSGRVLEVLTTEPGVQLFTGNCLDDPYIGKSGHPYPQHGGFCLETQHFTDSVNRPEFPTTILRPDELYASTTCYRLGAL